MLILFLHAVLTIWVCFDAHKRNIEIAPWALGTALLGVIIVPIYLAKRSLLAGEIREGGTAWNVLKNFAILWTIAMGAVTLQGLVAVSEHSTGLSGAESAGAAIGTALGLGMIGAIWLLPFVGAFILGFMLKKSSMVEKGPTGRNVVPEGTESAPPRIPVTPIGWGCIALSAIILIALFNSAKGPSLPTPSNNSSVNSAGVAKEPYEEPKAPEPGQAAPEPAKIENWSYSESDDDMGRGKIKTAMCTSTNTLSFGMPYDGPQNGSLMLRRHPEYGKDVILRIERGQFLTGIDGCNVKVRFDERKVMTFWANPAADHSSETVFISGYSKFVENLKKAKRVRIQAPFYQEGNQVLDFNVEGLVW